VTDRLAWERARFVDWPADRADRYRAAGVWAGTTLFDQLADVATASPDAVALIDDEHTLTYGQLIERTERVAGGLRALGLARGDAVVVQLPNTVEFVVVTFACFRTGVRPVMALPALRDTELGHLVATSEAAAIIVPAEWRGFDHEEMGHRLTARASSVEQVVVTGSPRRADSVPLSELSAHDPDRGPQPPASDVALFLLSGGTTGLPKLIPRTHDDYVYNATVSADICEVTADDRYLVALPAGHNFPLGCPGIVGTLSRGGTVVMAASPEPVAALGAIARHRVTLTAAVPAVAQGWLEAMAEVRGDRTSWRLLQVGGSRLADEIARHIESSLGCRLQQVFGMAEGLLNFTRPTDPAEVVWATQGRPASEHDEIRIVDDAGDPVVDGQVGELWTRGPYTICGYFNAEAHNRTAFAGGWYRTGDLVRLGPGGNLVVEGRSKDQINRGGEKISAEEIENLAYGLGAIELAAAVAVPDPDLGERVGLCVVLRPGTTLTLEAVRAHFAASDVARFKYPELLQVYDQLPLTNVGKVDKARLRKDLEGP
jgi:2,3-dihydroxybenzoate-AMP ligase